MNYLPIFLDVRGRLTLVIGGGAVAARKVALLLQAGAHVRVIAPSLVGELREMHARGALEHIAGHFESVLAANDQVLRGVVAMVAASNDRTANTFAASIARARAIPVNVVDDARQSTFIVPAIVDRSPVLVAIGTQGTSPVLARHVRSKIEALLPPQFGRLGELADRWRERVRRTLSSIAERRKFWEGVLDSHVASLALAGNDAFADFELRRRLKHARAANGQVRGEVYLVGAGPGDPDLLTIKAARLLQQADVVLYDRLVSPGIVDRARRDAQRIFVGKEPGRHHVTQERTQELMLQLALEGKRVCRLKGGDPFVFGRGGEELEALAQHGIAVTVVPGITAALGAAAYAGIPLTHREHAHSVTFVSGHVANEAEDVTDWASLARHGQTAVFYMGVASLASIVNRLVEAGAPASRPAAIVENATLPTQRVIEASLGNLVDRARQAHVSSPALLIVGEVAGLRATTQACAGSQSPTLEVNEARGA